MGSAALRLLQKQAAPSDSVEPAVATPAAPAAPRTGSAAARLMARLGASEATSQQSHIPAADTAVSRAPVSRGTFPDVPDTADIGRPTAPADATKQPTPPRTWLDFAKRDLGKYGQQYRQNRQAQDMQALSTPLEVVGGAITSVGRGIAHTADEALYGNNPLGYRGPEGDFHQPFLEGVADIGGGSSWEQTLKHHLPVGKFDFEVPSPLAPWTGPQSRMRVKGTEQDVAKWAGLPLDVGLDPATYSGLGALTAAGKDYRAAQLGKGAAELMLGGALDYKEAAAATARIHRSMDELNRLKPLLEAEGTLPSRGRALMTFAGRTNPAMAQGNAVAIAQRISEKVGGTRVASGLSHLFQPEQERIPEELKGRWFAAAAARGVSKREALRGLDDLIREYPDVMKAVGGDAQAFNNALSLAHERSMARQYHNPVHWLSNDEATKYFEAAGRGDKATMEALSSTGLQRARANLPAHLTRAERHQLRESTSVVERNQNLRAQLETPTEYSEQLGQKELSASERSELQRLQERRAKVETKFLKTGQVPAAVSPAPKPPLRAVAQKLQDGRVIAGQPGQVHAELNDAVRNAGGGSTAVDGYVTQQGKFVTRAQAYKKYGYPDSEGLRSGGFMEKANPRPIRAVAVKYPDGRVVEGRPGETHMSVPGSTNPDNVMGFTDQNGRFLTRDEADALVGERESMWMMDRGLIEGSTNPMAKKQKPFASGTPKPALANPNDEKRIAELQGLAVARAEKTRARSLQLAERGVAGAQSRMTTLTTKAQARADLQALQNSIGKARRMFYRGASPEAQKAFGDYATKMVDRVNTRNAAMFSATRREGVKLSELSDVQAYMLHATTPEAQKAMLEAAIERGEATHGTTFREWSEKHGPQMTRKMRMTAVEANQLAADGKLGITGGRKVKEFFYTNPLIAQVMREEAGGGAMGYARHLREAAAKYGKPAKSAPKGWRTVPNEVEGIGDKIAFEPEVADHLTRHHWALQNPGRITEAYDRMNQIWKTYTLGIFPNYHVRNEMSDFYNAVILGGMNLKHLGPSIDDLITETQFARKVGRKHQYNSETSRTGEVFGPGELRDEAEGLGVMESNQIRNDLETEIVGPMMQEGGAPGVPAVRNIKRAVSEAGAGETGVRKATSKVGAGLYQAQRELTDNRAIRMSVAIGNLRESAFRLALYRDRRLAGWGPEAAATWVRKHLIDYGQLSNFETEAVKRVLPFYTWTRHNAPLQLEYLFAKPGATGAMQHLREHQGGEEGLGAQDVPLPSFLQEGYPIRTGRSSQGDPEFWRLEGTWPGADAMLPLSPVTDPARAVRRGMSMVTPFLQEPIEQGTNQDWFRSMPGKSVPIEYTEGETGAFLGMNMPKKWSHALQNLRPLSELNRLNPGNVFGTSDEPGAFGEVREYPDIDEGQRWLNLLYGRGYAINEATNRDQWERAFKRAEQTLERDIARAEEEGKWKKAEQKRRQLDYLHEHPESISPDMAK